MTEIAYNPSADDVAALMLARARDADGNIVPFGPGTSPSADEVEALIAKAAGIVAPQVGALVAEAQAEAAKLAVTAYAAMLVEASLQQRSDSESASPGEHYRRVYEDALRAVQQAQSGDPGGAGAYSVALKPAISAEAE